MLAKQLARFGAVVVDGGFDGSDVVLAEPSPRELATVLSTIEEWVREARIGFVRIETAGDSFVIGER